MQKLLKLTFLLNKDFTRLHIGYVLIYFYGNEKVITMPYF